MSARDLNTTCETISTVMRTSYITWTEVYGFRRMSIRCLFTSAIFRVQRSAMSDVTQETRYNHIMSNILTKMSL